MSKVVGILCGEKWDTKIDYMRRVYSVEDTSPTIATVTGGGMEVKIAEPSGLYLNCSPDFFHGEMEGLSRTIKSEKHDAGVVGTDFRIRKLTPLECWRLMGFDDEDFYRAKDALNEKFYGGRDKSSSQLYKMAGNSIVVQVLEAIFAEMF